MDKADEQRLLRHAWTYGHFRNPLYPDTWNVAEADLATLSVRDEHARQAIASVQMSDCQCDEMCWMFHGRGVHVNADGMADGVAGLATLALINIRRCKVPDFATDDDEFGLAGSGRWLKCDETREHSHEVVIKFDDRQAPSKWVAYMDEVKANAVKISADVGLSLRYIDHNSNEEYQSSVLFQRIGGSTIGYYYLPQGSGCRRVPQGALDTGYQPDVEMASILWVHEGLGHGIGLRHTNGGIMNPSINRTSLSWRGDPSWRTVEDSYGGVPLEPDEPPDPPGEPDKPTVISEFVADKAGQKFQVTTGGKGSGWF